MGHPVFVLALTRLSSLVPSLCSPEMVNEPGLTATIIALSTYDLYVDDYLTFVEKIKKVHDVFLRLGGLNKKILLHKIVLEFNFIVL